MKERRICISLGVW